MDLWRVPLKASLSLVHHPGAGGGGGRADRWSKAQGDGGQDAAGDTATRRDSVVQHPVLAEKEGGCMGGWGGGT